MMTYGYGCRSDFSLWIDLQPLWPPSHVSRELKRGAQYCDLTLDWPENPFLKPRIRTACFWEEHYGHHSSVG